MQLHLVERLPVPHHPRHERALAHVAAVPRQRHHHPCVVAPHAHRAAPGGHPQRPCRRPQAKRAHDGILSRRQEPGLIRQCTQPLRARRLVARNLRLVVQQQRSPLSARPHRRMERPPMHLVHVPRAVNIAVIEKVTQSPHPSPPRPHMLRHPVPLVRPLHHPLLSSLEPAPPLTPPVTTPPRIRRISIGLIGGTTSVRPMRAHQRTHRACASRGPVAARPALTHAPVTASTVFYLGKRACPTGWRTGRHKGFPHRASAPHAPLGRQDLPPGLPIRGHCSGACRTCAERVWGRLLCIRKDSTAPRERTR